MCGFVGGTDRSWDIKGATDSIRHRGPDAGGLHENPYVTFGFRRLSIIDLDPHANQPMLAGDGETCIVMNGEIYGFAEVRRELETKGRAFRTQSDTEVALQAFEEWGDDFVEHIDGMFAIVIWDPKTKRLKLFRDRPGIKPLYYFYDGKRFAFASELKALCAALPGEEFSIDYTAVYDFLGYRYVPAPKTLYKNCFKLPQGHRLEFDVVSSRLIGPMPFWTLPVPDVARDISADEAAEELRALIDNSVRKQMVSDVPLGFFLSGGVDSSVVVASATSMRESVSTFSIGFDSDAVSETRYARQVAEAFSTDHHERILFPNDAEDLLPNLKTWYDEPAADESAMPTYLVSKVARENVTVVLTGDGGDEVFGGYRTYPRFDRYNNYPSWPTGMERLTHAVRRPFAKNSGIGRLTKIMDMAFSSGPALWGKIMSEVPAAAKWPLMSEWGIPHDYDDWWQFRQHWRDDLPVRTRLQVVDFHTYMPGMVLQKVDRTSMAVSLEARVPLLDRDIIEFSFSLPESVRYYNGQTKGILKHAYSGILSDEILHRKKKGFGIPRYYLAGLADFKYTEEYVLRLFGIDVRLR